MSSPYPILGKQPIDQWKVTELREELKRRKLTTKGLKEDLVKRLFEAIRSEQENTEENTGDGLDSAHDSTVESVKDRTDSFDAVKEKDAPVACDLIGDKVESEVEKVDVGDNKMPSVDGKVEGEPVHSIGVEVDKPSNAETSVVVVETVDSVKAMDEHNSQCQEIQNEGENPGSKSSDVDVKNDLVSKVSPVLECNVISCSVSTDISISKNIETTNNSIADVEQKADVMPEVHLSSGNAVPCGESHPMDVEELHDNKLSVVPGSIDKDTRASDSSEKLHLEQDCSDDSMEENVSESKQIDSKLGIEKNVDSVGVVNAKVAVGPDDVRNHTSADEKLASVEDKSDPTMQSVKRKVNDDEAVASKGTMKRQRVWNSGNLEIPQNQSRSISVSNTPKNPSHPTFKRSLSMSNPMASEEPPKERVVPPSAKPATNSLRIDRFLRPFTLKAVQELLGKTGTVTSFWMNNIKTHCYVSYSSVEEANETRNALYNLQWPPNGGNLLVAEFVDPVEVKMHVEAPPQSPVTPMTPLTPVSTRPVLSAAPPAMPAQISLRQIIQRKQQQQPPVTLLPPPPPPQLRNPPPPPQLRNPPPVKERYALPPPPPLPVKLDPPIVTLDDLFRKTTSTPRIYYLPLSDEQVEAKLKAQGKDTKP